MTEPESHPEPASPSPRPSSIPPPPEHAREVPAPEEVIPPSVDDHPDEYELIYRQDNQSFEDRRQNEELRALKLKNDEQDKRIEAQGVRIGQMKDDKFARKFYGPVIFGLTFTWLFCVLAIVLLDGYHGWKWLSPVGYFDQEPVVMGVLLGTTTANVVGLMYAVVRYLYPRDPDRSPKD